jgi:poly-gamma-glutamate capsule biosynthesis protein CapA/YwtB (metallophosphatase superfamily)
MSLADDTIAALQAIKAIGENLDSLNDEHPMRHAVRGMKRTAEAILTDAIKQATDIAYQANQLIKDYDASITE